MRELHCAVASPWPLITLHVTGTLSGPGRGGGVRGEGQSHGVLSGNVQRKRQKLALQRARSQHLRREALAAKGRSRTMMTGQGCALDWLGVRKMSLPADSRRGCS